MPICDGQPHEEDFSCPSPGACRKITPAAKAASLAATDGLVVGDRGFTLLQECCCSHWLRAAEVARAAAITRILIWHWHRVQAIYSFNRILLPVIKRQQQRCRE